MSDKRIFGINIDIIIDLKEFEEQKNHLCKLSVENPSSHIEGILSVYDAITDAIYKQYGAEHE